MSMQLFYGWWRKRNRTGSIMAKNSIFGGGGCIRLELEWRRLRWGCRTLTALLSFPWSMDSVADSASIALQFFSRSSCFESVPERYYLQFSLRKNAFSDAHIKTGRVTEQTECKFATLCFSLMLQPLKISMNKSPRESQSRTSCG